MACVDRRGSRWRARWRDPAGRQKAKTFRRRADAEAFLKNIESEMQRGNYVDPALGRERLATFWTRWHALAVARLRPSTLSLHELYWHRSVKPAFGDRQIGSITRLDVQSLVGAMINEGISAYTIETVVRVLRTLLNAAEEDGLIAHSPMSRLKLPKRPTKPPTYFTAAEVELVAATVPERWHAFILLAAYGGLRFGELTGLYVDRIDFLRKTVRIDHAIVEAGGKLHAGPTKNRQVRTIAIPDFVMESLAEHVRNPPPGAEGLVFTEETGGPVGRSRFYKRVWWPALERSGIRRLKFHALRHTSAALAIAAGAHPKAIQERLGHHSAAFTLDTYGGLFEGIDRAIADRLEDARPSPRLTSPTPSRETGRAKIIPMPQRKETK